MSQHSDILVPKDRDAVFIHCVPVRLPGMLGSQLRILKSPSRQLLSGLIVPFLMGFRGTAMSVGGAIVQFSGPLMVLVMGSVVVTLRHSGGQMQKLSCCSDPISLSLVEHGDDWLPGADSALPTADHAQSGALIL